MVVITSGAGLITSVKLLLTVLSAESRNVTVTPKLPAEPGVPLITPLDEPIESPAGSPVAVQEYGASPPSGSIGNEYKAPTVPEGSEPVFILRGGAGRKSCADANTKANTPTVSAATFNPVHCFTNLTATPLSPKRNGRSGRYQTHEDSWLTRFWITSVPWTNPDYRGVQRPYHRSGYGKSRRDSDMAKVATYCDVAAVSVDRTCN